MMEMVFVDVDRKMNDDVYVNVLFCVVVCYIHFDDEGGVFRSCR
jgi:hypothetical protein